MAIIEDALHGIDGDEHTERDQNKGDDLTGFIFLKESSLCYVEYDFDNFQKKPTKELFNLGSLSCFDGRKENFIIVGSCNGLVCLTTKISTYLLSHAYICNPTTQECVQLNFFPDNTKKVCYMFYGFGYLPSSNEYKAVVITYIWDPNHRVYTGKVQVYTLGDGRGWRAIGYITTYKLPMSVCPSIFVDGALFWVDGNYECRDISVFDLKEEKFYLIPVPLPLRSSAGAIVKLVVLQGQLCLFWPAAYGSSHIWLLEKKLNERNAGDFDVKEQYEHSWSWRKATTVKTGDLHSNFQPLTVTKNGDILMLYPEPFHKLGWKLYPKSFYRGKNNVVVRCDQITSVSKELGHLDLPLPGYGKFTRHASSCVSLKSLGEQTVFGQSIKDSQDDDGAVNKAEPNEVAMIENGQLMKYSQCRSKKMKYSQDGDGAVNKTDPNEVAMTENGQLIKYSQDGDGAVNETDQTEVAMIENGKQTGEEDDMTSSETEEDPSGPGQPFGEGEVRHSINFGSGEDWGLVDVGGFRVLKTQAPLYRQIWLKYGHIPSTKVMPMSMYPAIVMVVGELMTCILDMHQCRLVELSSNMIEHWEEMIMMAEKNEFNVGWLRERLETVKNGMGRMQHVKSELLEHGQPLRAAKEKIKMLQDEMKKAEVQLNEAKAYLREKTSLFLSESDMEMYLEIGDKLLLDGLF